MVNKFKPVNGWLSYIHEKNRCALNGLIEACHKNAADDPKYLLFPKVSEQLLNTHLRKKVCTKQLIENVIFFEDTFKEIEKDYSKQFEFFEYQYMVHADSELEQSLAVEEIRKLQGKVLVLAMIKALGNDAYKLELIMKLDNIIEINSLFENILPSYYIFQIQLYLIDSRIDLKRFYDDELVGNECLLKEPSAIVVWLAYGAVISNEYPEEEGGNIYEI